MTIITKLITLLLILFFSISTYSELKAQEYLYEVENITTDDGLANLLITSLYKSPSGLVWIGTRHGLNRYDGYSFKLYTSEKHQLSNSKNIKGIQESNDGLLWVFSLKDGSSTEINLDIFDPVKEKAVKFDAYFKDKTPFLIKDILFCDVRDAMQRVWISTKKGELYKYEKGTFLKIISLPQPIQTLTIDKNNNLWLSADSSLYQLDTNYSIQYQHQFNQSIFRIFNDNKKKPYVITYNNKSIDHLLKRIYYTWKLNPDGKWQPFEFKKKDKSINIIAPFLIETGYWISSVNGSIQVFKDDGEWIFDTQPLLSHNLNAETGKICSAGDYFLMASSSGILKLSVKKNPFTLVHHNQNINSLSDSRAIIEDKNGSIYFSNQKLYKHNPITKVTLPLNDVYPYPYFNLHVYNDSLFIFKNELQIVQLDKLSVTKRLLLENNDKLTDFETSIFPNKWVLGSQNGLYYYDVIKQSITPFPSSISSVLNGINIIHIYRNPDGLWMTSEKGIFFIDEKKATIRHFSMSTDDLPTNKIRHIYEDEDGAFWLSSIGGGIIKWQPNLKGTPSFEQFTIKDGLSNNYIYAIYEDNFGYLWVSSDKGLMRIEKVTFQIQTFLKENGLPHNEFNYTSHYQTKDGTMYFGGLGGIISFHPKDFIKDEKIKAPLIFTNYTVLEGDKEEMTNRFEELILNKGITIQPSDKLFELSFALTDFAQPKFHQYKYNIEGYSKNWTFIDENKVRITNLPYGKYKLIIKGQHINKGWSNEELTLEIHVIKPFYLQIWFIIILILIISIAAYTYFRLRLLRLKRVQIELEEEVKMRTATIQKQSEKLQVLDKAKTRFFSNITHEFRTPLTLILGPLEQIKEQQPPLNVIHQRLSGVHKNANQLLNLINQLLDISKLEDGNMKIEVSHGDIIEQTKSLLLQIQPLATKKQQELQFNTFISSWEVDYDQKKWNKIIFNLLSNAVKFTPQGGRIIVSIQKKISRTPILLVTVEDNGQGIAPESLPHIFNRFYQTDDSSTRLQEGTGIGLALVQELVELQEGTISVDSQLNKGTTFTIEIPVIETRIALIEDQKTISERVNIEQKTINSSLKTAESVKLDEKKLQLLIIEDNTELRAYIRSCINEDIYQIFEASNGEEGIQKAFEIIPDLIISDVMMPIKDGFEVTETIRNTLSTSHIPLILLTAKSALESRIEGLERGADAYLTKPFSPKELVLRIQKLIELRQMLQSRYSKSFKSMNNEPSSFEKEDKFIDKFKDYILQNLVDEDLNGDKLGEVFYLSRMQLHRKIKALTNLPTGQFVRKIRLEKAKELLQSSQMNVAEIAYATGFSSPTQFSRAFKKHFGVPPSELI